jgi:hypothetical protein
MQFGKQLITVSLFMALLAGCGGVTTAPVSDGGSTPDGGNDPLLKACEGKTDGSPCGNQTSAECNRPDICQGGVCVPNHVTEGTACGDQSDTECTKPDSCDGAGACLPNHVDVGSACGDQSDTECTKPDTCDGAGGCLSNDVDFGSACGDQSDTECTQPDTCDGAGSCLSNHVNVGSVCGDLSFTECTNLDTCDGAGSCLPNHAAVGSACGDQSDTECTRPDTCDGAGSCLSNHVDVGSVCGDQSDTECTNPDTCDGAGVCLPNHAAVGTPCGDGSDIDCDGADTCSPSGTCLSNVAEDGAFCSDCDAGPGQCDLCAAGACPTLLCQSVPTNNVETTFVAGNNHRGNMVDIQAAQDLIITSIDVHPMGNTSIEVYTTPGTYMGKESSPAAWTFHGTSQPIVAAPYGTPTPVPLPLAIRLRAGERIGLYVTSNTTAVSLNYTDGMVEGALAGSDENLSIFGGCGLEYPFTNGTGGVFRPRIWNGRIHYKLLSGLTTSLASTTTTQGSMFDVHALTQVEVTTMGLNLAAGVHDVDVYFKRGSHVGAESDASAWVPVASSSGLSSAGADTLTWMPLDIDVIIPAGNTYAFYVTTHGTDQLTTAGTVVGQSAASDTNLSILEGTGVTYPLGTSAAPQLWNGRLGYRVCE